MGARTAIEWTDATWNPLVGCSRVSPGCTNCYAERLVHRGLAPQHRGLTKIVNGTPHWTGEVRLVESALPLPLRWRTPRRVFVNSLSDLFHEAVPFETVAAIFGVMNSAQAHTFQVLTKRPERMQAFFRWVDDQIPATAMRGFENEIRCGTIHASAEKATHDFRSLFSFRWCGSIWPLPNVWLGVSAEDQKTFDERVPLLGQTPAAVRFVSAEPLLGEIDAGNAFDDPPEGSPYGRVDWLIVGGESGPGARPIDLVWMRALVAQCKATGTACFVKQLGRQPYDSYLSRQIPQANGRFRIPEQKDEAAEALGLYLENMEWLRLRDRKGGDPREWPEDLRVREFPA